jgi:hypothetical protein
MLILAAFSRHAEALDWAEERMVGVWGPLERKSTVFDFTETEYYTPSMGPGIKKVFFAFAKPFDAAEMVEYKLATNAWEEEYAELKRHPEPRPLNLDPGYLTLGKLVLASTKDFAHRIYLHSGIFAEVTLFYKHHRWQHHEYTFADYRRADYQQFFSECRDRLHERLSQRKAGNGI